MAKTRYDRIRERQKDISEAEKRIQAEEKKLAAAKARIAEEKKKIRSWKEDICRLEGELLVEKYHASKLPLEDALAAIELQSDNAASELEVEGE